MRPDPGARLPGGFHIVRPLEADGAAMVFEAQAFDRPGRFVVKVLCEGGIRSGVSLESLRREALAASELAHPGIARIHALDRLEDGSLFVVTEYVNGRDLGKLLRAGKPLALSDIATLVEEIAAPLAEAHRRKIVHGDLTPDDVLVLDAAAEGQSAVKILDFGVARIRARAGVASGGARAASAYAAPERQAGREDALDERADVFSLGAIAGAMIGDRSIPAPAASALRRAKSARPADRFRSVNELAQALRAGLASSPRESGVRPTSRLSSPALPATHPPTQRARASSSSLWKTVAAAAGCGAALLLGVIIGPRLGPSRREAPRVAAAPQPPAVMPAPAPPPAAPAVPAAQAPAVPAAQAPADAARLPLPAPGAEPRRHRRRSPHADMTEEARREMKESYEKATRAFDLSNYDEAIEAYKHTYELGGDAPMLYNIAQALRLSKRPAEAVVYYRRYLSRAPDARNAGEVRARIADLTSPQAAPEPDPSP